MSSIVGSAASSPQTLQERGSLRTLREGESQFIGSSSGIYFINTVRRAFSDANKRPFLDAFDKTQPSPEDCIVGDEEDDEQPRRTSAVEGDASVKPQDRNASSGSETSYGPGIPKELGQPPPPDLARALFMKYFQTWHRFFPFLHGPTALKDIESICARPDDQATPRTQKASRLPLARVIILQCMFNLASLDADELPVACRIAKPADILSALPGLAAKSDMVSIQALFAAQLFLVARLSLRTAAAVGGLLSRSIFLAGLHRCPVRYQELSTDICNIRKRLFWSIYVVDRYLSQALGHPLGIQDSDVDVCSLAGPERHLQTQPADSPLPDDPTAAMTPSSTPVRLRTNDLSSSNTRPSQGEDVPARRGSSNGNSRPAGSEYKLDERYLILYLHAEYSRLVGRAVELFHKSIHVRSMDPKSILSLRTDVNAWWNSLPSHLQDFDPHPRSNGTSSNEPWESTKEAHFSESAFLILLHNQLILLINRPWLSLESSSPEFHSSLQICISVARNIISVIRKQHSCGFALFWPGYLSATWMAGIILAFACHLHLYPADKGNQEISLCLEVMSTMSKRWSLARNCHTVLTDLQRSFRSENQREDHEPGTNSQTADYQRAGKRRRTSTWGQFDQPSADSSSRFALNLSLDTGDHDTHQPAPGEPDEVSFSTVPRLDPEVSATFTAFPGNQVEASNGNIQVPPIPHGFMAGMHNSGPTDQVHAMGGNNDWLAHFGGFGNWDGGMPDLLAGATWESLTHAVNQDNLSWDDVFR